MKAVISIIFISILPVSFAASLQKLWNLNESGISDFYHDGKWHVYITDIWNLTIIDVSNPSYPTLKRVNLRKFLKNPHTTNTYYRLCGVTGRGDTLYLLHEGGVLKLDISNREHPKFLRNFELPFLLSDNNGIYLIKDRVLIKTPDGGLYILDEDSSKLLKLAYVRGGAYSLYFSNEKNLLAVATGRGVAFLTLDFSSSLPKITSFTTLGDAQALGIWIDGDRAYAIGNRLCVFDVSDPTYPKLLKTIEKSEIFVDPSWRAPLIYARGNLAVVAHLEDYHDVLTVFDLTDPENPKKLYSVSLEDMAYPLRIFGFRDFLYYLSDKGFYIFRLNTGALQASYASCEACVIFSKMKLSSTTVAESVSIYKNEKQLDELKPGQAEIFNLRSGEKFEVKIDSTQGTIWRRLICHPKSIYIILVISGAEWDTDLVEIFEKGSQ